MSLPSNARLQALLACYATAIFLAGIWSADLLTQGDESDYIRSSQEMLASGELLSPTLRDELRFTKPPLLYWAVVASYDLFGVSFFSARLPVVLMGVLTVVFVFRFGVLLFEREAALVSALLTATCLGFVKFSKIVLMEGPLTLTLLLSFYYFARFYRDERLLWLGLCAVFLGLSGLWKSPIYSLIGGGTLVVFLLLDRAYKRFSVRHLLVFLLMLGATVLPWFAVMLAKHGNAFFDFYTQEHVAKLTAERQHPFKIPLGALFYLMPWSLLFLYAFLKSITEQRYREWPVKLLLVCIACYVLIFMLPRATGHYYAIPMLPYCGLLTGGILMTMSKPAPLADALTAVVLLGLASVLALPAIYLGTVGGFVCIALLVLAAFLLLLWRSRILAPVVFGLATVPFYLSVVPGVNLEVIPVQRALEASQDRPLFSYRLAPLKFSHSLGRPIREVRDTQALRHALNERGVVIITQPYFDEVDEALGENVAVLLEWKRWKRRLRFRDAFQALRADRIEEDLQESVYLVAR